MLIDFSAECLKTDVLGSDNPICGIGHETPGGLEPAGTMPSAKGRFSRGNEQRGQTKGTQWVEEP